MWVSMRITRGTFWADTQLHGIASRSTGGQRINSGGWELFAVRYSCAGEGPLEPRWESAHACLCARVRATTGYKRSQRAASVKFGLASACSSGRQASVPNRRVGGLAPGIAAGEHFFGSTVCANGSRCRHSQVQEHARNGLAHLCSIVHVSPFQNIGSSPEFLGSGASRLGCRVGSSGARVCAQR